MTTTTATAHAQTIAERASLSADEALFLQSVPTALIAAIVRGEIDVAAIAREELAMRGLNLDGRWVGFAVAGTCRSGLGGVA